jgi:hypothetical protein
MTRARIRILGTDHLVGDDYDIRFTWKAERRSDWEFALGAVKAIPSELRSYDEITKVWTVRATAETQMALSEIFPNFWGALDAAQHPQEALF